MGAEATCIVTFKGKTAKARVRLETNVLQIRAGELNVDVPFNAMKGVRARDGSLLFRHDSGLVALALGKAAAKWVDKILHPPSRLTKIGVRPQWRTAVLGTVDKTFVNELRAATSSLSVGRTLKDADAIFIGVSDPADYERVSAAKSAIKPDGAVWLIRPKGSAGVTESAVIAAGRTAGLVDVKVVALSPTHSALKFVIPLKNRSRNPEILQS
jgi:hypothetical protein